MTAQLAAAYPEIALLVMACVILMVDLFTRDDEHGPAYFLTLATLLLCTVLSLNGRTELTVYAFHGMFVADHLALALKLALYVATAATLIYGRHYALARGFFGGEFLVLLLFGLLGMMIMVSAGHLLSLYLGLELLSLCLYALVALDRDSVRATEAAMKYFVLGALASGLLLYGMSMLYGATGTLDLAQLADQIGRVLKAGGQDPTQTVGGAKAVLIFGLVFIVAGLAFKLGVVPFHMWVPDIYHGSPTAITILIGGASKLAAFAMAFRLLVNGLGPLSADWQQMLILLSVASMALGNLAAIAQTNLKRMLAYSAISHMGFMLLGLIGGQNSDGYSAAMFYALTYVLTSLPAFGMLLLLSRAGFEADALDDFKGLARTCPWHAFLMLLLMFSMAGVPPMVGFYAKFSVLQAVIQTGHIWLAVVAVLFSLIGAFYYLRVVKLMYFDEPAVGHQLAQELDLRALLTLNSLAVLGLGLMPQSLMAYCALAMRG